MPRDLYGGTNSALGWEQIIRMEQARSFGVPKAAVAAFVGVPMPENVAGGAVVAKPRDWISSIPSWSHMCTAGLYTLAPGVEVQRILHARPAGPPAEAQRRGGRDGNLLERIRKEERAASRSRSSADKLCRTVGTEHHPSQVEIDRAERKARDFPRLDTREDRFPAMRAGRHHLYDQSLVGFDGLALSGEALTRSIAAHDARASAEGRNEEQGPEGEMTTQERARADERDAQKEERRAQIRELRKQLRTARHERAKLEKNIVDMSSKGGVQVLRPQSATPAADIRSLPVAAARPCAKVSEMSKQPSCHRDMFGTEPWRSRPQSLNPRIVRKDGLRTSASAPNFGGIATSAWTLEHSPQGNYVRVNSHVAGNSRSAWKTAQS
eukprot:scaffold13313_cov126-Isochrysis_galbana.AAC.5